MKIDIINFNRFNYGSLKIFTDNLFLKTEKSVGKY